VITGVTHGEPLVFDGTNWINDNKVDFPVPSTISATGSLSLDRNNGECQRINLAGNTTISGFSNFPASRFGRLALEINNTAAHTLSWPTSVKWQSGIVPTVSNGMDIYVFVSFDGTSIYGNVVGQNYHT